MTESIRNNLCNYFSTQTVKVNDLIERSFLIHLKKDTIITKNYDQ